MTLNISRNGIATTSLGNLFQCLTTLIINWAAKADCLVIANFSFTNNYQVLTSIYLCPACTVLVGTVKSCKERTVFSCFIWNSCKPLVGVKINDLPTKFDESASVEFKKESNFCFSQQSYEKLFNAFEEKTLILIRIFLRVSDIK